MANWNDPPRTSFGAPSRAAGAVGTDRAGVVDQGLRRHMLSIYNYMTSGVLLTGIVALLFANSGYAAAVLGGPGILKYLIMFAPLAFVMVMSFGINRISTPTLQLLF